MKSSQSLQSKLKAIRLEENYEEEILNTAIKQLDNGENEFTVLKEIKVNFRQLALNKKLSQKGVSLYTELQKPNLDVDTALSSITWFQ